MTYPDAGITLFYPTRRAVADASSVDVDLTALFPAKFATKIYVGGTGDIVLQGVGDAAGVKYQSVPAGTWISGCFTKVVHTGTTATKLVAEGF